LALLSALPGFSYLRSVMEVTVEAIRHPFHALLPIALIALGSDTRQGDRDCRIRCIWPI